MRIDKQRNIDKIAAELIKDPMQTQEEIAAKTGVSHATVSRALGEVSKLVQKDDRIVALTDDDFEIVRLTQRLTLEKLNGEEAEKTRAKDLAYIGDVSAKRYSLLQGSATDEKGGLHINIINFADYTSPQV